MNRICSILFVFVSACISSGIDGPQQPIVVATAQIAHYPFAFDSNSGPLVFWSAHKDDYIANPIDFGGALGFATSAPNFYISSVSEVDGVLVGMSYITTAIDDRSEKSHGWLSRDGGKTWTPQPGIVRLPSPPAATPGMRAAGWGAMLFHRRSHVLGASIYASMYGNFETDGQWYRSVWARSVDKGATWDILSTIAAGQVGSEGYGEPVTAICEDGRILAVMRSGPYTPMYWSRSENGGRDWSVPLPMARGGWDPDLLLTPSGLLLSSGLPGHIWVDRSHNCGDSWQAVEEFSIDTTSGYSGLAHDETGRLRVFTDRANETEIVGYPMVSR